MVYNPHRMRLLINEIRSNNWESISSISDDYIIDIDSYQLIPKNFLDKKNNTQNVNKEENDLENLLYKKYLISIEQFRVEHNFNIDTNRNMINAKKKVKTHVLPGMKSKISTKEDTLD